MLIGARANLDLQLPTGATPLFVAASNSKNQIVEMLVQAGAHKDVLVQVGEGGGGGGRRERGREGRGREERRSDGAREKYTGPRCVTPLLLLLMSKLKKCSLKCIVGDFGFRVFCCYEN